MVDNFAKADAAVANAFFQAYYTALLQDLFFVLTDTDHKSGFKMQTQLLMRLYQLVESSGLQAPIFDPSTVPDSSMTNQAFLREFSASLLKNAFPHLPPYVSCSSL
jgi:exportin-1